MKNAKKSTQKNTRLIRLLVSLAAATALLVPCLTLFQEGDWLYYVVREEAMKKAWLETGAVAAVLFALAWKCRNRRVFGILAMMVLLAGACLHSMLLPLAFAGLWFIILTAGGDLLTGICVTLLMSAALSLFHACTPVGLLAASAAGMAGIIGIRQIIKNKNNRTKREIRRKTAQGERFFTALVTLVIYVQLARANQCIDFDSLWYGVRSSHVLCPGGSIFEDLGLVGMVYTYSKGFEILTLPLSALPSYAGISALNLYLFILGIHESHMLGRLLGGEKGSMLAPLLTALVPGIVNMTLSAKPDLITWLLQLMMLRMFFACVAGEDRNRKSAACRILSTYLISLTMKPTALIFSTALLGMMFLWTLGAVILRRKSTETGEEQRSGAREFFCEDRTSAATFVASVFALLIVWGRTMKLTGMPFTSVFSGVLEKLGFTLKYPFTSRALPSTYQEGSQLAVAVRRLGKMLLSPDGTDMKHVRIAWCGSLFFVIFVILAVWIVRLCVRTIKELRGPCEAETVPGLPKHSKSGITGAALWVFLPFLITCFITLMMLYQVDGNYYMTAYSILILLLCLAMKEDVLLQKAFRQAPDATELRRGEERQPFRDGPSAGRAVTCGLVSALGIFQFLIMTMTNWAGVTGFFPIQANAGYYDHVAYYREVLSPVDGSIYEILSRDPETRVVCFGEHPTCLQFPCVAQSYNDITSPWGNVELVNSAEAMIEYLRFAGVDYVYAEAAHFADGAWSWSYGLLEEMLEQGVLTDVIYEGDNWIARVN